MSHDLIVLDAKDNVATAMRVLAAGESIEFQAAGRSETVAALETIPFGHKVALVEIRAGEPVLKYGEVMGFASVDIPRGGHVHTHNVAEPKFTEERS